MKRFLVGTILMLLLAGCQPYETMSLLDESVETVYVSESQGRGDMNLELLHSFKKEKELKFWERAITNARLQSGGEALDNPDYDVMVEYKAEGDARLPTHAIHLWLGKEGEKSYFMYIEGDGVYETSAKVTKEMREYLLSGE
ncbi:hypothetical protein LC085_00170 [Bacillus tianshenii]|uniref:lipoprotein n=1 Tax=Sutcliffiella tianshenii TaxID=1463404 RepID=UPI001CD39796|nr:hypothetical protein [Bacillus tianshenii]MCA1318309.1 hypothetical protein [Bacillus tianshenii]